MVVTVLVQLTCWFIVIVAHPHEKAASILAKKVEDLNIFFIHMYRPRFWLIFSCLGECVEKFKNSQEAKHYSKHNNKVACEAANGEWLEFHNFLERAVAGNENTCLAKNTNANKQAKIKYIWARPIYQKNKECLVALDEPTCIQAPFSRVNHLGNGADLEPLTSAWSIPYFPSQQEQRCVLRLRYLCYLIHQHFLVRFQSFFIYVGWLSKTYFAEIYFRERFVVAVFCEDYVVHESVIKYFYPEFPMR